MVGYGRLMISAKMAALLLFATVMPANAVETRETLVAKIAAWERPARLALGDSILARTPLSTLNGGVGGYRAADVLAMIGYLKYRGVWPKVSCLSVSVGVNDALNGDGGQDADRVAAFTLTLEALIATTAGKPIVLNTVVVPAGEDIASPRLVSTFNVAYGLLWLKAPASRNAGDQKERDQAGYPKRV